MRKRRICLLMVVAFTLMQPFVYAACEKCNCTLIILAATESGWYEGERFVDAASARLEIYKPSGVAWPWICHSGNFTMVNNAALTKTDVQTAEVNGACDDRDGFWQHASAHRAPYGDPEEITVQKCHNIDTDEGGV